MIQKYLVELQGTELGDLSKDIANQLKDDALVGVRIRRISVRRIEDED